MQNKKIKNETKLIFLRNKNFKNNSFDFFLLKGMNQENESLLTLNNILKV